jgi:hypothetical protein
MGDAHDSTPENPVHPQHPLAPFPDEGGSQLEVGARRARARDTSPSRNLRPEEVEVLRVALGDFARRGRAFRRNMGLALLLGVPVMLLVIWWSLK